MTVAPELDTEYAPTTDGEIAVINLESGRRRSWTRFWQNPLRDNTAETVIEYEQLTGQIIGDLSALDRLELLAAHLAQVDGGSTRTALIQARVASITHRFSDARCHLADAVRLGAPQSETCHLTLNIEQACGINVDGVLDQRRAIAERSGRLDDLVPFGALLADLREFVEADDVYRRALRAYRDVSPFPVAWVCFQLGLLWGELVPEAQISHAAEWYRRAIDCLSSYTKARVHLAEIYLTLGRASDAEALLMSAVSSGDPEVHWRLADVMASQGRLMAAEEQMQVAKSGFEMVLARHLLAFADHGAEFYAGSGDARRALELTRINVANRPTLRAFEQARGIAVCVGNAEAEAEFIAGAHRRWGATAGFRSSSLWEYCLKKREGMVV